MRLTAFALALALLSLAFAPAPLPRRAPDARQRQEGECARHLERLRVRWRVLEDADGRQGVDWSVELHFGLVTSTYWVDDGDLGATLREIIEKVEWYRNATREEVLGGR